MHVVRGNHTDGVDLVSLADMKEFLRVDHSDEDTTITALLDTAVAWAEDYTNRLFHPNGSADFYLSRWRPACLAFGPVTAIDAVKYDVPGATYTLDASKYYYETAVEGEPIWDVVARWLKAQGRVQGVRANQPEVMGLQNNQGIA